MKPHPDYLQTYGNRLVKELTDVSSPLTQMLSSMDDGDPRQRGKDTALLGLSQLLRDLAEQTRETSGDPAFRRCIGVMQAEALRGGDGTGLFLDDHTPNHYVPGLTTAGTLHLLEEIEAGRGDKAVTRLLRQHPAALNPKTTALFEGQANVNLPGLQAGLRMRTTGQDAPKRFLPQDIATQLQLETGARAVEDLLAAQQLDVEATAAAVTRDQEIKIARAEGFLAQIQAGIPNLVAQFTAALGIRHQRIETVTDDQRTVQTTRRIKDGNFSDTRTVTARTTDGSNINAPAKPGELRLPSASITIEPSRISQYAGAGFAMGENSEAALVAPHVGPNSAEVTAQGHIAIAAASVTVVESGGMTVHFDGGSMRIGG